MDDKIVIRVDCGKKSRLEELSFAYTQLLNEYMQLLTKLRQQDQDVYEAITKNYNTSNPLAYLAEFLDDTVKGEWVESSMYIPF